MFNRFTRQCKIYLAYHVTWEKSRLLSVCGKQYTMLLTTYRLSEPYKDFQARRGGAMALILITFKLLSLTHDSPKKEGTFGDYSSFVQCAPVHNGLIHWSLADVCPYF